MCDVLEAGVTAGRGYGSPFSNRGELCDGRVPGHRKVTILLARFESLHIIATSRLARLGGGEECCQQKRNWIRLFFRREFGESHPCSTTRPCASHNQRLDKGK